MHDGHDNQHDNEHDVGFEYVAPPEAPDEAERGKASPPIGLTRRAFVAQTVAAIPSSSSAIGRNADQRGQCWQVDRPGRRRLIRRTQVIREIGRPRLQEGLE